MQPYHLSTGQLVSIDHCRAAAGRRHLNLSTRTTVGGSCSHVVSAIPFPFRLARAYQTAIVVIALSCVSLVVADQSWDTVRHYGSLQP